VVCLTLTYLSGFIHHPDGFSILVDGVFNNTLSGVAGLVCLGRAALFPVRRRPFLLFGLTAWLFTAGNLINLVQNLIMTTVPYPSWADVGYLGAYPVLMAGLTLLAWPELKGISPGSALDGVISGLCCAATGSFLIVQPVLGLLGGSALTRIVGAAYPVFDLTLLALTVAVITLKGGRPSPTWIWLTTGICFQVLADSLYLHRLAVGSYVVGTPLDALWAVGLAMIAIAATCSDLPTVRGPELVAKVLIVPNIFSVIAVAILIFGSLSAHRLPVYVVGLTCAALMTAVKRTAIGFSALRLLAFSQHQAQTDELTQLANRRHFEHHGQHLLVQRPPDQQFALVMMDLNAFKAVNDTFGHQAGDEMLRQIASRLRRVIRSGDVLARLGGDEFVLLLPDCDRETALTMGERLRSEIGLPMIIDGTLHLPGASVGIAICPDDGDDLAELVRQADIAMFDAKTGRRGSTLYDAAVHRDDSRGLNVRESLNRHELCVHYQPQFDLRDGRMTGVEALVRWNHPTRGLLLPDVFLSSFERAGLMAELTLEVLTIAARDRLAWQQAGTDLHVSVNVAPSALLSDELTTPLLAILAQYRMPTDTLTLEVTESAVITDIERSRQVLTDLRSLGIQLSLDDYGTGYCSLTYVRELDLHEIKIDRSFVTGLRPESTDAVIVASTVWMAKKLQLRTVAEGIEHPAALTLLRDLGCDTGQGYLLALPMPAAEILSLPQLDWPTPTSGTFENLLN